MKYINLILFFLIMLIIQTFNLSAQTIEQKVTSIVEFKDKMLKLKEENPNAVLLAAYDFDDTLVSGKNAREGSETHEVLKALAMNNIAQIVLTARLQGMGPGAIPNVLRTTLGEEEFKILNQVVLEQLSEDEKTILETQYSGQKLEFPGEAFKKGVEKTNLSIPNFPTNLAESTYGIIDRNIVFAGPEPESMNGLSNKAEAIKYIIEHNLLAVDTVGKKVIVGFIDDKKSNIDGMNLFKDSQTVDVYTFYYPKNKK